jgi:hypothetical protein
MTKLLTILLLLTTTVYAQIDYDAQNLAEYKSFSKWLKTAKDSEKVYMEPTTVYCSKKKDTITLVNHILGNGGNYQPNKIKYIMPNCNALPIGRIGRIIQSKKGSNIVKIRYIMPYTDNDMLEKYFYTGQLTTVAQKKKEYYRNKAK